eukprot:TRINITY_DN75942_c0_g1_i1.p1 TRINITY_DN75942_c0_g1~~TRINITY_DN75942_c0_g1_i1.p1  ORF type:complete len:252 (+),score=21.01 TRINITY_DN75942_c0_g1_i1:30-785(+)
MGTVCTSAGGAADPVYFTEDDINRTYDFIFDSMRRAMTEMYELEMIGRDLVSPPKNDIMRGLLGVAALDIAVAQRNKPNGIVMVPGSEQVLTKKTAPEGWKDQVSAMIDLKDALAQMEKEGKGVESGEMNKVKHWQLHAFTDQPVKVWGTALQDFEPVTSKCHNVIDQISLLPQWSSRIESCKKKIQADINELSTKATTRPAQGSSTTPAAPQQTQSQIVAKLHRDDFEDFNGVPGGRAGGGNDDDSDDEF